MDIAPWLQAFAAVAQGGAAVIIVRLTRRLTTATEEYVRLTHDLAQAARAQQEDRTSQRAADHDYLGALVEQLRDKAQSLPEGPATAVAMLNVILWTPSNSTPSSGSRHLRGSASLPSEPPIIFAGSLTGWTRCN